VAATERPRAAIALLALLALATGAGPGGGVGGDGHYYPASDGLEVWHPQARATVDANEELAGSATYDADVISAATVDVRTAASPRGFRETRHGVGADLAFAPTPTLRFGVDASGSFAPDFASGTVSARLALEDEARIHALSLSAAGSYAGVGRVGDQSLTGESGTLGLSVAWTTIVSEALVLDVAAAGELAWGYLESPYRFVTLYEPGLATSTVALPEAMPDQRLRASLRARVRVAPTDEIFLRGSYRLHADDWGVLGHTAELGASVAPIPELLVSVDGRYVGQRAASFYRGRYETLPLVPVNRTRDRELAGATTLALAARIDLRLPIVLEGQPTLFVRGELSHTRLYDTWLLPERVAGVLGLGLTFVR